MEFSTIKLSDKQRIEAALAPLARNDSSLGFANIFGMQEKYGTRFCIEDNALYLRQDARVPGMRAYYPPLGTNDLAGSIARLAEEAMLDGPFAFVNVTPEEKHLLQAAGMPWTFTTDRNFAEYLYRTEDIAEYRGAERAKKRREVRKFFQLYGPRVRIDAIGPGNLDAVANYQCAWFFANMSRRMSPEHPLESEHRKILLN